MMTFTNVVQDRTQKPLQIIENNDYFELGDSYNERTKFGILWNSVSLNSIPMKSVLYIFLFICFSFPSIGQEQYYSAYLQNQKLTVDETALIEWGREDFAEVRLFKIQTDGYAEFSMEPVINANVGLAYLVDENLFDVQDGFFGFKFSQNSFDILVEGEIVEFQVGTDLYSFDTTFKVEKCGDNINYYKDGVLLFTFCDSEGIGELFQLTTVFTAVNSLLDLNFFENVSNCASNIISNQDNQGSFRKGLSVVDGNPTDLLEQSVEPNKYILIQVIDSKGKYIRQFKKRSNSKGLIMGCDEIRTLLKKSDYGLNISIAD